MGILIISIRIRVKHRINEFLYTGFVNWDRIECRGGRELGFACRQLTMNALLTEFHLQI